MRVRHPLRRAGCAGGKTQTGWRPLIEASPGCVTASLAHRFFKRSHLEAADAFYRKYGAITIIAARFMPFVRTFAPIVAGVSRMHYRTFVTFNLIGGALWAVGITLLGYFLGQVEFIERNLEVAILAVVAISVLPIVIELLKARRERKSVALDVAHDLLDPDLGELTSEAIHPDGRID